ncbi:MAG: hypothetical protein NDI61_07730 [Bdellovibrionaceae bacterium]|nr:hypothetical protein [Pseudobdellovibrionaceae bacterium]
MYLVLRSTRARGRFSLRRPEYLTRIRSLVSRQADTCRISILQFVNDGQSLHFLIHVPSRASYLRFIRSVCGLTSRMVTGSERGPSSGALAKKTPAAKSGRKNRFWDVIPYSRIAAGCATIKAAQKVIGEELCQELGLTTSALRAARGSSRPMQKRD